MRCTGQDFPPQVRFNGDDDDAVVHLIVLDVDDMFLSISYLC